MLEILGRKNLLVWLVLMLVTIVSWLLSLHPAGQVGPSLAGGIFMIVLAFIKVRLVIIHFMEIDHAPLILRIICEAWVACGCIALGCLYAGIVGS